MKKLFAVAVVFLISMQMAFSQNVVTIFIKNSNLLPKKPTVVSYEPGQTGNSTNSFVLMPGQKKRLLFPIGTKIFLASAKQVDVVMAGKRIDADKPFLIVKQEDEGKVFEF